MSKEAISIFKNKDKELVVHEASVALSAELVRFAEREISVLLLVSGGSAFKILDDVDILGLGSLVTIGVLDERYSTDSQVNNYQQLMRTSLFEKAGVSGCDFIDTRVEKDETQEGLGVRFEKKIRMWKEVNPTGQIVITQGMGPDGHTSGILPFPENPKRFEELFMDPEKWVSTYDADTKSPYPLRVTTTLPFLRRVDKSFLFVCGEEKRIALSLALAENGSLPQIPARVIHEMSSVSIFTDILL